MCAALLPISRPALGGCHDESVPVVPVGPGLVIADILHRVRGCDRQRRRSLGRKHAADHGAGHVALSGSDRRRDRLGVGAHRPTFAAA
jgi:hypothetical protein